MKKRKNLLYILFIAIGVFFVSKMVIEFYKKIDRLSFSNKISDIPKDYLDLLSIDTAYVDMPQTALGNYMCDISMFTYMDKYAITVLKLPFKNNLPVYNMVNFYTDLTSLNTGGAYSLLENRLLSFSHILNFSGDSLQIINIHMPKSTKFRELVSSDSVGVYFIKDSYGFNLKYNNNDYVDVSVEMIASSTFEKEPSTNMLILFKKYQHELYFYLIHKAHKTDEEIDSNAVNLFIKNN